MLGKIDAQRWLDWTYQRVLTTKTSRHLKKLGHVRNCIELDRRQREEVVGRDLQVRHRLFSKPHDIGLMIDCRNYSQEARRGGDYSGSHERYRKPARSTAPLPMYVTTWYVQGRLETISTPSAASSTILWGSVAVIRIESVDGLEMRRKNGRWFQTAPYTNSTHRAFSTRASPQRTERVVEYILLLPCVVSEARRLSC